MRNYTTINGFKVLEHDYDNYKGKYNLNGIFAEGMCMRFSRWLNENDIAEDTAEEVYNNTSGLRDGNRLDIHDNYNLTEDGRYYIAYIWALENGIVYATVYDTEENRWAGDIEVSC